MSCSPEFLSRFSMMLSNKELSNLQKAKVILFGVGGVGGSVAEMLIRSGIKNLTIVDFDVIDVTNINRQIVSYSNNVGKLKVEELQSQLLLINPDAKIIANKNKLTSDNINEFNLVDYDYIVDCIDDLSAKKALILHAKAKGLNILCAMGAGNRYRGLPQFEIADISKTSYDAIAKIIRKFCVQNNIGNLNVCFTKQKPMKFDCKKIGSVIYYTTNMASIICAKIVQDILEG